MAKKMNFFKLETDKNKKGGENVIVVFGSLRSEIKGSQRHHVWKKITTVVKIIGVPL